MIHHVVCICICLSFHIAPSGTAKPPAPALIRPMEPEFREPETWYYLWPWNGQHSESVILVPPTPKPKKRPAPGR